MIPSEDERKKIFFWLQRISSVTAWRRILDLYKVWAASAESSVQVAELSGWQNETSLKQSTYIAIMKCVAHCEKAVGRLQKGDKRVFKFDSNGEFEMGGRSLGHWSTMIERLEIGENGISVKTPLWPQFCDTLIAAATAWGECGPYILEPRYLDEPGLILYGVWLEQKLKEFPIIEDLPAVPNPSDDVFVRTNDFTPFSGIWEPIGSLEGATSGVLDFLKRSTNPKPPFKIAGAMNYLHGGSRAPRITIETSDDNIDMNTDWRLLWRDNRYEDGTIPEIESQYVFTEPKRFLTRPAFWLTGELTHADSGDVATVSGKWQLQKYPSITINIERGQDLPLHDGSKVRWFLSRS